MSMESWGRWIRSTPARFVDVAQSDFVPPADDLLLAYGLGRSYGDSCLNNGHTLLAMARLGQLTSFDEQSGVLQCQAGATLAAILQLTVPRGWFLPVTPGTKFVTVGGCIANDVHGKNHHRAGTFGVHVRSFELVRSNGERVRCRPNENSELYQATIGGLGLTGLIVSAEIQLQKINSPQMIVEALPFHGLDEFAALSSASDEGYDYTVAWLDAFGGSRSRGIFFRGNHDPSPASGSARSRAPLRLPVRALAPMLNRITVRAFNAAYFYANARPRPHSRHYEPFFYPLDTVENWNAVYGKSGFVQYQFVIPDHAGLGPVGEILDAARPLVPSPLTVIKKFGSIRSPGILSFPQAGTTVAIDFAARRPGVLLPLLERFDDIVAAAGGSVYPAKDARMGAAHFRSFFPRWQELASQADPRFSSSFWRRVTQ